MFKAVRTNAPADADVLFGRKQNPVVRREYKGDGEWVIATAAATDDTVEEFTWKGEKRKRTVRVLDLGGEKVEFVKVPAGSFRMGSPESDKNAGSDEKPQHKVTCTNGTYFSVTHE